MKLKGSNVHMTPVDPQTKANLLTALHGEAFAYAKYRLFAEHARQQGRNELAALFDETARTELLEHFTEEAGLLGLVGDDEVNLQDAIRGEAFEVDTMYRTFAEEAQVAGDGAAAERFTEIRSDEARHLEAFRAALKRIRSA
jgi:rubrerythrin